MFDQWVTNQIGNRTSHPTLFPRLMEVLRSASIFMTYIMTRIAGNHRFFCADIKSQKRPKSRVLPKTMGTPPWQQHPWSIWCYAQSDVTRDAVIFIAGDRSVWRGRKWKTRGQWTTGSSWRRIRWGERRVDNPCAIRSAVVTKSLSYGQRSMASTSWK